MGDKREQYSVSTLMESGVREALLANPFREVYWITIIEATGEQVYRPLRMLMMLEQFWLFCHGVGIWHPKPDDLTEQDAVLLFADYCTRSNIEVKLWFVRDKLRVLHMGIAVGLGDNGIQILDDGDCGVPDDEIHQRSEGDLLLTNEQFASASAYFDNNGFLTAHYIRAATPANLRYPMTTAFRLKLVEEND